MSLLDLPDLAAREQDGRAEFDAGRVVQVDLVGHERPEQTGRAEQNQDARQDRDRRQHQAGRLEFHFVAIASWLPSRIGPSVLPLKNCATTGLFDCLNSSGVPIFDDFSPIEHRHFASQSETRCPFRG